MKKLLCVMSVLYASMVSNAQAESDWDYYHNEDYFSWTNYDNGMHILSAYGLTLTTAMALQRFTKLSKLERVLISTIVGAGFGIVKETMFDRYTSRTDIQCWTVGALAGGLTVTVFQF